MIGDFGFTVEFDPRDLTIGRKFLRKLQSFPPSIWDYVEDEIKKNMEGLAGHITSHSVSPNTVKWRKWQRKKGIRVETHKGVRKIPRDSSQVGDRTGTFIGDLEDSKEPGVSISRGPGDYGIANGAFSYRINADAFAEIPGWGGYPNIFSFYLQSQGIIPEGGYLGMIEGEE